MIPLETLQRFYECERTRPFGVAWTEEQRDLWYEIKMIWNSRHKMDRISAQRIRRFGLPRRYCKGRSRHAQRLMKFLKYVRRHGRREARHVQSLHMQIGSGKTASAMADIFTCRRP